MAVSHLVEHQFKPGHVGGPGRPKGSKNLSTMIRGYLENEQYLTYKKKRIKALPGEILTAVMLAQGLKGDVRAADWLGKYGYGNKVDVTSGGEPIAFINPVTRPIIEAEEAELVSGQLIEANDQETQSELNPTLEDR